MNTNYDQILKRASYFYSTETRMELVAKGVH